MIEQLKDMTADPDGGSMLPRPMRQTELACQPVHSCVYWNVQAPKSVRRIYDLQHFVPDILYGW